MRRLLLALCLLWGGCGNHNPSAPRNPQQIDMTHWREGKIGHAMSFVLVSKRKDIPIKWRIQGLPSGLFWAQSSASYTVLIYGTPTATGRYLVTINTEDAKGQQDTVQRVMEVTR